jgi:hypothetical protein
MRRTADATTLPACSGNPRGKIMKRSSMAALGVAVSGLALLCGPATGQPLVNPPVASPLTQQAPRLTSIAGAPEGCTGPTVYAPGGAYSGRADVFSGPMGLVLFGSRLQDIDSVSILMADGTRLQPTSMAPCAAGGASGLRVTFNLSPGGAEVRQGQLQVRAPEPAPLVKGPGSTPQPTCIDRLTGKPTGCPQLPARDGPRVLNIADVQLTIFPRPNPDSSVRPEIRDNPNSEDCRGRVIFPGRNLAQTRPDPDISAANAGVRITVVSRSAQGILADVAARCPFNSGGVLSSISAVVPMRRGPNAEVKPVDSCDTCSDLTGFNRRFGGWGLLAG